MNRSLRTLLPSPKHLRLLAVFVSALLVLGTLASVGPLRPSPAAAANLATTRSGPVSVEFTFASADFINTVSVTSPVNRFLFNTEQSRIGTRVELGVQNAGTTLAFQLVATTGSGTFTWSSDPAQNSDGKDHLRVTERNDGDATLDDRVYKLEWEDEPDLGDQDFNDAVAIVRIGGDTDGDGLFDDWERFGIDGNNDGDTSDPGERDLPNGIDQNGDGDTTDPGERADPNHKDVFIEMDWMDCATAGGDCAAGDTHSHRPQAASVTAVVQAFRAAPVGNPDSVNGINLHIDVSNAVAHQNVLNFNGGPVGCNSGVAGSGFGDFDTVKAANFSNAEARRYAFHYALAIHIENQAGQTDPTQRFSGCAEIGGNDFYISFGGWGAITVQQESGTIMHELGHNLGLLHGGGENTNFKPNYLSLMSYSFQLRGIPPSNRLDYSTGALPRLDERNTGGNPGLNETLGIQDGADNTIYSCPDRSQRQVPGTGAIDWNCNGSSNETGVSANVNDIGSPSDATLSALNGFDDWTKVAQSLAFQTSGDFQDGAHPSTATLTEVDLETAQEQHLLASPPDLAPVAPHSGQYSDPIAPYVLRASDSDSSCAELSFSASGLPGGLTVTNNGDCTATVRGAVTGPAGTYQVVYSVRDAAGASDATTSTFTVTREDAVVTPSASNPAAVRVSSAGGTAGPFTLRAAVTEAADGSAGNLSLATPVTYRLTPVDSGQSYDCTATTSGGGVGGTLQTSCTFTGVAVNLYDVTITVGGSYQGSGTSSLTVFDPSLGSVTAGATVTHNGVPATVALTARYLSNGQLVGSLAYVEHRPSGDVLLTSTTMGSLAIVGRTAYIVGTATRNGVGNHSFRITAIDNDPLGTGDRFGLQVRDPSGAVLTDLTFAPVAITIGNIVLLR